MSPRIRRLTGVVLALLALACGDSPTPPEPRSEEERIVVYAPSGAEILDELGLLDRVIGVGEFVRWPLEVRTLPAVGSFLAPNVETVLELRATLLLTTKNATVVPQLARLETLGVERIELPTDTYEGLLESITLLGDRLGRPERARELAAQLRMRMEEIAARVAGASRPRVLFVIGRDPLYVAGPGSHVDQMITTAGGTNVAADALAPYQLLSLEAALERLPEVIVESSDNRPGALRGRQPGPWSEWPFLPAVAGDRIYWVDPERLSIAGPRLPEMTEMVGRMIHPEIFGEPTASDFLSLDAVR